MRVSLVDRVLGESSIDVVFCRSSYVFTYCQILYWTLSLSLTWPRRALCARGDDRRTTMHTFHRPHCTHTRDARISVISISTIGHASSRQASYKQEPQASATPPLRDRDAGRSQWSPRDTRPSSEGRGRGGPHTPRVTQRSRRTPRTRGGRVERGGAHHRRAPPARSPHTNRQRPALGPHPPCTPTPTSNATHTHHAPRAPRLASAGIGHFGELSAIANTPPFTLFNKNKTKL